MSYIFSLTFSNNYLWYWKFVAVNILIYPEPGVHNCPVKIGVFLLLQTPPVPESLLKQSCRLRPVAFNFIKKENPALVFSSEFRKIFENAYFLEQLWTIAPTYLQKFLWLLTFPSAVLTYKLFFYLFYINMNLYWETSLIHITFHYPCKHSSWWRPLENVIRLRL